MNKIRLSINEPCHEKWKNMTATEQGRFCASCQKEVVDFTNMSDTAVFEFFKDRQAGSVCGRFMNDQLKRDIEATRKRSPWLPFVFKVTLPALLLGSKAMAQGAPVKVVPDTVQVPDRKIGRPVLSEPMRLVKGILRDEEGNIISHARITNSHDLTEVTTDEYGRFELSIPRRLREITFSIEAFLFERQSITRKLSSNKRAARLSLTMKNKQEEIIMGLIAYPGKYKAKKETVCETDLPLRVYPNPVAGGQKIWIKTDSLQQDNYTVQLLDQAGVVRHQQAMQIDGKNKTVEMSVPRLIAGNYLLTVTAAANGQRRSSQIVLH
ncbi:MAG: T9SS type A sorting domain-containing protein [Chitinophagaceae bacterium]